MSPVKARPVADRLLSGIKVDSNGCWVWQRSIMKTGYGCIRIDNKTKSTHRTAYLIFKGAIPDGLVLDHLCRNRACCNPDHLEAVTQRENNLRGESRASKAAVTHCPKGHEYDAANTYLYAGRRFCRECQRVAGRAYKQRKRKEVAAA